MFGRTDNFRSSELEETRCNSQEPAALLMANLRGATGLSSRDLFSRRHLVKLVDLAGSLADGAEETSRELNYLILIRGFE
jgi:hypothetical protein